MAKLQLVKVEELDVCGSLVLSNPVTFRGTLNLAILEVEFFLIDYINSQIYMVNSSIYKIAKFSVLLGLRYS